MLTPRAQATVLLTVPFPGERNAVAPLSPTEWGRLAAWLQARSLTPESLLSGSPPEALRGLEDDKITPARVAALLERGAALGLLVDKWSRAGIWVMTRADADYPSRLKRRLGAVSPAVLFGCGRRALLEGSGLAVVGSRNATDDDLAYSRRLGQLAAGRGYTVVSGGARGVDEASMRGALESEGTAVGVLTSDLLQVCTSARFREAIARGDLVLVSATNPEARFNVGNAMGRNKYIYCLADAAVVVHSGTSGGTWSGAMENLKKGWVPLWIKETTDPAAGNHPLLGTSGTRPLPADLAQFPFETLLVQDAPQPEPADAPAPPPVEPSLATTATSPVEMMTFYELFVHKVRELCWDKECRPDELAETLQLHRTQLDIWLKQAVEDGHLVKLPKPVRYQVDRQRRAF